ncbi:hypothetical protein LguiA_030175 [Lonicera macranthoides]
MGHFQSVDNAALILILRIIFAIYTVDLQFQAMIYVGEISSSHSPLQQMCIYADSYERANPTFTTIARHYRTLFRECARNSSLHVGEKLHVSVITTGLLTSPNSYLHNAILHMYATCGTPCSARKVFDEILLPHKDTVDWTTLMGCYTSTGMAGNPSSYSLICKNTVCCLTTSPLFVCSTRVHN